MKLIKTTVAMLLLAFAYILFDYAVNHDKYEIILLCFIPLLMVICLLIEGVADYFSRLIESIN